MSFFDRNRVLIWDDDFKNLNDSLGMRKVERKMQKTSKFVPKRVAVLQEKLEPENQSRLGKENKSDENEKKRLILKPIRDNDRQTMSSDRSISRFKHFNDFDELVNYPPNTTIRVEDFKCLDCRELITLTIIDFYIQYIHRELLSKEQREKVHIYCSNFYNLYSTSSDFSGWNDGQLNGMTASEKRYSRVQNLSSNTDVDLFSKDFIIVPLNDSEHWFLAIVCINTEIPADNTMPIKSVVIYGFDSIKSMFPKRNKALKFLRDFFKTEHEKKYLNTYKLQPEKIDLKTVQVS